MRWINNKRSDKHMKAIVTVVGKDQVGIIAGVCNTLAASRINVLDISQTIMEGYFTMMMVVDLTECQAPFDALRADLKAYGEGRGLSIRIQREDIFDAMHKL